VVLLLLCSPVSLQEPKTRSTEGQRAEQTVGFLPTDWGISKSQAAIITLTSSISAEDVEVSDWWNAKSAVPSSVAFKLVEKMDKPSKFLMRTNSNEDTIYRSSYQLALNNTGDIGRIEPHVPKESRFVKWADSKEKAGSTFIREGWSADVQIIRP